MSNKKKHNIKIKDEDRMNHNEVTDTDLEDNDTEKGEISTDEISPEQEIARLKDTLLRKAAEFENYKRRTDTEISNYIKYASENLKILLFRV